MLGLKNISWKHWNMANKLLPALKAFNSNFDSEAVEKGMLTE